MQPGDARQLITHSGDLTDTYLGSTESSLGIEEHVGLSDKHRLLHVLNLGPTGYGKSQLMVHAALQDAYKGHGLCIINPKGGLIDEFLTKLPEDRREDVIYVNPNRQRCPAINVLEATVTPNMRQGERDLQYSIILDDLIAVFRRLSGDWGERWGRNLRTLLRAHLHLNTRGEQNTLMDVFDCVRNADDMTALLDRVHHPLLYEELQEIHALSDREMEPLQRRFRDFLESETIRRIITQPENHIDFQQVLDDRQILLVDVQKGTIGTTAATLIGSIFLTKIWSAAQARITQPADQRTPFYLYVDELHTFANEGGNFQNILSEAREYKLGCWLATQYLRQLPTTLRSALLNNCRTKLLFNPSGSEDIAQLTDLVSGVSRDQLTGLGKYRAVVQPPAEQEHQDATIFDTYPPWTVDPERGDGIKTMLLEQYPVLSTEDTTSAVAGRKGTAGSAGGEAHAKLLEAAYHYFTAEGWDVTILHQDGGSKPDGHLLQDGAITHLEAEHNTLSKPGKVLRNVQRAVDQDRELVFVVEAGEGQKLHQILADPVNRRMTEANADGSDDDGPYRYYRVDGEPVTDITAVQDAVYTIYEHRDDTLIELGEADTDPECPELAAENATEDALAAFCLYRAEDGHCEKLGTPCVIEHE
ncbi:type IV secretion system DNA-binding domain-containing protein [Halomontanus rarus]|uniref:type IV secretion system DNA-binding domain-containing protein n=1 Tax=Halomontanus rarus TaxID=3034020 RepID=UPI001A982A62